MGIKKTGIFLLVALVAVVALTPVAFGQSIQKNIQVAFNGIKVYLNDDQLILKDAQGSTVQPFIYNGTTYLPIRAISQALGKDVSWDGKTNSVFIGEHNSTTPDIWLGSINVFNEQKHDIKYGWIELDNGGYEEVSSYMIAADGKLYDNQVLLYLHYWLQSHNDAFKYEYLINQDFKKFQTTYMLSNASKSTTIPFEMKVYGDDVLLYESGSLTGGFTPQSIDIDVSGVVKLSFVIETLEGEMDSRLGIVLTNPGLYK